MQHTVEFFRTPHFGDHEVEFLVERYGRAWQISYPVSHDLWHETSRLGDVRSAAGVGNGQEGCPLFVLFGDGGIVEAFTALSQALDSGLSEFFWNVALWEIWWENMSESSWWDVRFKINGSILVAFTALGEKMDTA